MRSRATILFGAAAALATLGAGFDAGLALLLRAALRDQTSLWVAVGVVVVVALRGATQIAVLVTTQRARETLQVALRRGLIDSILAPDARAEFGATALHLAETLPRAVSYEHLRASAIAYLFQIALLAGASVWIAPGPAAGALAGLVAAGSLTFPISRRLQRRAAELQPVQLAFVTELTRVLRTMPLIRALRLASQERERLDAQARKQAELARDATTLTALATALPAIVAAPCVALALVAARWTGTDAASLIALLAVLVRATLATSSLSATWGALRAAGPAHAEARALLAHTARESSTRQTAAATRAPELEMRSLVGEHGTYPALELGVPPGAHIGVLGPSGSGKTTLLATVLGLVPPASGEVLLDGEPAVSAMRRLAATTGYAGPEPYLFAGSLRENLCAGRTDVPTDADLRQAMARAAALDVLDRLPGGLDEIVGEGGAPLSSGERQRVALARALVGPPRLLVLDEPTTHLGPEHGQAILDAVSALRGDVTCIMSAHRPELLDRCDEVVHLAPRFVERTGSEPPSS